MTTYDYRNHAVRSEDWRYIRDADGGEDLYHERTDPNEWQNLAANPEHAPVIKELTKAFPAKDQPDIGGKDDREQSRKAGNPRKRASDAE